MGVEAKQARMLGPPHIAVLRTLEQKKAPPLGETKLRLSSRSPRANKSARRMRGRLAQSINNGVTRAKKEGAPMNWGSAPTNVNTKRSAGRAPQKGRDGNPPVADLPLGSAL